jgi:hypothetical protein
LNARGTLLIAMAALAAGTAAAAEPVPQVDADLLEFLGSLDTEDEEWRDYLAERPIRPEAGKPASPVAGRPDATGADKAAPGKEQDDKVKKP